MTIATMGNTSFETASAAEQVVSLRLTSGGGRCIFEWATFYVDA